MSENIIRTSVQQDFSGGLLTVKDLNEMHDRIAPELRSNAVWEFNEKTRGVLLMLANEVGKYLLTYLEGELKMFDLPIVVNSDLDNYTVRFGIPAWRWSLIKSILGGKGDSNTQRLTLELEASKQEVEFLRTLLKTQQDVIKLLSSVLETKRT